VFNVTAELATGSAFTAYKGTGGEPVQIKCASTPLYELFHE